MAESNTIDIVRGIAQAAANSYDGAHDEKYSLDGEAHKVGLKREEGDPIIDSRIMDGFSTSKSLTLSPEGEVFVDVQSTSRVRAWVQAYRYYKIGGLSDVTPVGEESEEKLEASIKKFLAIGKDAYPGTKKPKNVTRKGD